MDVLGTSFDLQRTVDFIIILLISITIHELAHAIAADRLGDPTPRRLGEISLNPFTHMDQFGIILLLITSIGQFGFTYGRTHVTPSNLKYGPQRGNALVAIVGPFSNLVLAAIAGVVFGMGLRGTVNLDQNVLIFLDYALQLNVLLFLFNLLPIPPLDGFTVLGGFLTARQMYALAPVQQFGPIVLLFLLIFGGQIGFYDHVLTPALYHVANIFCGSCYPV